MTGAVEMRTVSGSPSFAFPEKRIMYLATGEVVFGELLGLRGCDLWERRKPRMNECAMLVIEVDPD